MRHVTKKQPVNRGSTGMHEPATIDRDKLRAAIRKLGDEYVFYMLDEAIDLLPSAKLAQLVGRHLDVKQLGPDAAREKRLLDEVRAFEAAARAGKYYESFNVNSKNCTEVSKGTRAFIADCNRLLDRCVAQVPKANAAEIREAIEILLGLLRYIDECHDDVIFFADEGGAWQVGVTWAKVLPAWFACLSETTEPAEYARRVVEVVDEFDLPSRWKRLSEARRIGTPSQRKARLQAAPEGER